MAFSITIIEGNVGADPDVRYMPDGKPVANFNVAVSDSWKTDSGERKESTTWFRCAAYGKVGEIAGKYLMKGSNVLIEGRMQSRKYQKDGQDREAWDLVVNRLQMLGKRPDGERSESVNDNIVNIPKGDSIQEMDDDIPF